MPSRYVAQVRRARPPGTARRTVRAGPVRGGADRLGVGDACDVAVPDALAEGQLDAVEVLEQGGRAGAPAAGVEPGQVLFRR